jgi:hypothetical protein
MKAKVKKTKTQEVESSVPLPDIYDAIQSFEEPKTAEKDLPGFIRLTRRRSDRDAVNDLLIRPEAIESISIDVAGYSVLNGNRYLTVTESPEEILEMLKG